MIWSSIEELFRKGLQKETEYDLGMFLIRRSAPEQIVERVRKCTQRVNEFPNKSWTLNYSFYEDICSEQVFREIQENRSMVISVTKSPFMKQHLRNLTLIEYFPYLTTLVINIGVSNEHPVIDSLEVLSFLDLSSLKNLKLCSSNSDGHSSVAKITGLIKCNLKSLDYCNLSSADITEAKAISRCNFNQIRYFMFCSNSHPSDWLKQSAKSPKTPISFANSEIMGQFKTQRLEGAFHRKTYKK